jgi:Fe-S-cluster containining protein
MSDRDDAAAHATTAAPTPTTEPPSRPQWYRGGLRFACTECGKCCCGASGYVWVSRQEVERMAALVGMRLDDFGRRYLRRIGDRYALLEAPISGDCVFLAEGRCAVYEARPKQCRSYPWWSENLASADAWQRTARACEGIDDDAPLVSFDQIEWSRASRR